MSEQKHLGSNPTRKMETSDIVSLIEQASKLSLSAEDRTGADQDLARKSLRLFPSLASDDSHAKTLIKHGVIPVVKNSVASDENELIVAGLETLWLIAANEKQSIALFDAGIAETIANILKTPRNDEDDEGIIIPIKVLQLLRNMAMPAANKNRKTSKWDTTLSNVIETMKSDQHALIQYHSITFLRALVAGLINRDVLQCMVDLGVPELAAFIGGVQRVIRMPGGRQTLWMHIEGARTVALLAQCGFDFVVDAVRGTRALKSISDTLLNGAQHPMLVHEGVLAIKVLLTEIPSDKEYRKSVALGLIQAMDKAMTDSQWNVEIGRVSSTILADFWDMVVEDEVGKGLETCNKVVEQQPEWLDQRLCKYT